MIYIYILVYNFLNMYFHKDVCYIVKTLKPPCNLNMWALWEGELKTVHGNVPHDCGQTARDAVLGLGTPCNLIHRGRHGSAERTWHFVCAHVWERQ